MNTLKKHILQIFSITLSLVILMTTGGFSIHVHHCNHNHTSNFSLFMQPHNCNIHSTKSVKKSCCSTDEAVSLPQCDTSNDNGCCTDKAQWVKLDTKTILHNTIPNVKPIEIQCFNMLMPYSFRSLETNNTSELTHQFAESPPPLTTDEYLSRIQVYLI